MVRYMVGRDVTYDYKVGSTRIGEVLMEADGLCSGSAVQDISFQLHAGCSPYINPLSLH